MTTNSYMGCAFHSFLKQDYYAYLSTEEKTKLGMKQEHLELPGKQNFPLVALTKTDEKVLKALT